MGRAAIRGLRCAGAIRKQGAAWDQLTVYGDGRQSRTFTFVSDAVRATLLAGERADAIGEAFNVGSSEEISIIDAAGLVLSLTGSRSEIHYQQYVDVFGPRFEDTRRRVPDVRKAEKVLGFSAAVSLREGIVATADWWRGRFGSMTSASLEPSGGFVGTYPRWPD